MEKINIAELLKDCPKGMELDCTMYENVYFDKIYNEEDCLYPIGCYIIGDNNRNSVNFTKYGEFNYHSNAKCIIFPKGKTTWEGFVPPCKFKDGDIVSTEDGTWIGITTGGKRGEFIPTYCVINSDDELNIYFYEKEEWAFDRLATEEEKAKLFQAIKDGGYKWNEETKTLEKLVEPKFKVGDKIEKLGYRFTIIQVKDNNYLTKCGNKIPIDNQDDFILVPNKFEITTLKPFESKVLVRGCKNEKWEPAYWGFYDNNSCYYPYKVIGGRYSYCIPYKGNEHLLGITNDCDEYYKTWE